MAESKRTFQSAQMNKDVDDRLLPPGTYRDALNISVDTSEDANVGVIENLKGNNLVGNQNIQGLSTATNPNAKVIGSYADPESNKIYFFVTGDTSDGIFEYDAATESIHTVIIETSEKEPDEEELFFTFTKAIVTGGISAAGIITVSSVYGSASSVTPNFTASSTQQSRPVDIKVLVPDGYSNSGEYVYGQATYVQGAKGAPVVVSLQPTDMYSNSVTMNAKFTEDSAAVTAVGFYYMENQGGTTTLNYYANEISLDRIFSNSVALTNGFPNFSDPFDGVPLSDILVTDSTGATVPQSNYTYNDILGPRPSELIFSTIPTFPIKVTQISSATTITQARTATEIQTAGTQVTLPTVRTPFSKNITQLNPETKYAYVPFATNSIGTSIGEVINFETPATVVTVPSFSNTAASPGSLSAVFKATGNSDGGDPNTAFYVVHSTTTLYTVAQYTAAADTIRNGGTATGFSVANFTGFTSNVETTGTVTTTANTLINGLIFAENSAGRTYDTAIRSATSLVAAVLVEYALTASNFTNFPTGKATVSGTKIRWYTQSGTLVPGSVQLVGSLNFEDPGTFYPTNANGNIALSMGGNVVKQATFSNSSSLSIATTIADSLASANPNITIANIITKGVPIPFITASTGVSVFPNSPVQNSGGFAEDNIELGIESNGVANFNWGFSNSSNISSLSTPFILTNTGGVYGTWGLTQNGNTGGITFTDNGNTTVGVYNTGTLPFFQMRANKLVSDAINPSSTTFPGGVVTNELDVSKLTVTPAQHVLGFNIDNQITGASSLYDINITGSFGSLTNQLSGTATLDENSSLTAYSITVNVTPKYGTALTMSSTNPITVTSALTANTTIPTITLTGSAVSTVRSINLSTSGSPSGPSAGYTVPTWTYSVNGGSNSTIVGLTGSFTALQGDTVAISAATSVNSGYTVTSTLTDTLNVSSFTLGTGPQSVVDTRGGSVQSNVTYSTSTLSTNWNIASGFSAATRGADNTASSGDYYISYSPPTSRTGVQNTSAPAASLWGVGVQLSTGKSAEWVLTSPSVTYSGTQTYSNSTITANILGSIAKRQYLLTYNIVNNISGSNALYDIQISGSFGSSTVTTPGSTITGNATLDYNSSSTAYSITATVVPKSGASVSNNGPITVTSSLTSAGSMPTITLTGTATSTAAVVSLSTAGSISGPALGYGQTTWGYKINGGSFTFVTSNSTSFNATVGDVITVTANTLVNTGYFASPAITDTVTTTMTNWTVGTGNNTVTNTRSGTVQANRGRIQVSQLYNSSEDACLSSFGFTYFYINTSRPIVSGGDSYPLPGDTVYTSSTGNLTMNSKWTKSKSSGGGNSAIQTNSSGLIINHGC